MAETSQARGSDEREEALIHQINDNGLGVGSLQTWGISTPFPCNVLKYIAMLATDTKSKLLCSFIRRNLFSLRTSLSTLLLVNTTDSLLSIQID